MKRKVFNLMMLLSLTAILAFVMPVMSHAQRANFAGTWTLNESKSTLPEGGNRMMGGSFTVAQEANLLTQTRTTQDGTQRVTKYTLDGKESVNTTPRGESKSVATWSPDGKSLAIKTSSEYNGNTFTITSVWSLSDAKTLSVLTSFSG